MAVRPGCWGRNDWVGLVVQGLAKFFYQSRARRRGGGRGEGEGEGERGIGGFEDGGGVELDTRGGEDVTRRDAHVRTDVVLLLG